MKDEDDESTMLEDVDDSYKSVDYTGISDYKIKSYDTGAGDADLIWNHFITISERYYQK